MGVDHHVYVGPYIKVHNPKRPSTEKMYTCSNDKCKKHKERVYGFEDYKFCKLCGTEIKELEVPCMIPLPFDIYKEFNDRLASGLFEYTPEKLKDYQFFIGNAKGTPAKNIEVRDFDGEIEISPYGMAADYTEFCRMYDAEISRIIEVFGKNNVSITFGILHWSN